MTITTELRNVFNAARPLLEQQLDIAEQLAALRDVAAEKGMDWSQIKALCKATVQDDRDGGQRVKKLTEKADLISTYSAMLKSSIVAEYREKSATISNPESAAPSDASGEAAPPTSPGRTGAASTFPDDQLDIPECLRRDGATATAPPS